MPPDIVIRTKRLAARAGRAVAPPLLTLTAEAMLFGRSHGLGSPIRDQILAYPKAREFGLHFLPRRLRLDGLIVDVGANEGKFTAVVRRLEPRAVVIAVEPSSAPRARLLRRFDGDAYVSVDQRALSDHAGTATFHVPGRDVYGSLLQPRDILTVKRSETVTVTTLDDVVSGRCVRVLKIDVQGGEISVLRGGAVALASTEAVILEMNFVSLYEGDALFGEVDALMREAGFVLSGLTEANRAGDHAVYADACYVPALRSRGGSAALPHAT